MILGRPARPVTNGWITASRARLALRARQPGSGPVAAPLARRSPPLQARVGYNRWRQGVQALLFGKAIVGIARGTAAVQGGCSRLAGEPTFDQSLLTAKQDDDRADREERGERDDETREIVHGLPPIRLMDSEGAACRLEQFYRICVVLSTLTCGNSSALGVRAVAPGSLRLRPCHGAANGGKRAHGGA